MKSSRVDLKVEIRKILESYSIIDNDGNYSIPGRYVEKVIGDIADMYDKQFNFIMGSRKEDYWELFDKNGNDKVR